LRGEDCDTDDLMIDLVNFVSNFFELGSHFAYRSFLAVEIYSQEASQQSRSTHNVKWRL